MHYQYHTLKLPSFATSVVKNGKIIEIFGYIKITAVNCQPTIDQDHNWEYSQEESILLFL